MHECRNEASGIPHLLVAPKVQIGPQMPATFKREDEEDEIDRSIYHSSVGDSRGYYADGAYISRPEVDDYDYDVGEGSDDDDEASPEAIHNAYFTSLLSQYNRLRTILNTPPPQDAISRLPPSTLTENHPRISVATWVRVLSSTDPHPLQLALMSKDTILRMLEILLGGKLLRMGHTLSERTSRWLWALLARLPERGELNHAEVGWVRDLGRRAVLLGRSLREMALLREELEEGVLGGDASEDEIGSMEGDITPPHMNVPEGVVDMEEGEMEDGKVEKPTQEPNITTTTHPAQKETTIEEAEEGEIEGGEIEEGEIEEGEVDDSESVAMSLDSTTPSLSLEEHKARLLSYIDQSSEEDARERARINMRATVNMVLTVAGEVYGQRDLLEFREPFVGM